MESKLGDDCHSGNRVRPSSKTKRTQEQGQEMQPDDKRAGDEPIHSGPVPDDIEAIETCI